MLLARAGQNHGDEVGKGVAEDGCLEAAEIGEAQSDRSVSWQQG